MKALLRTAAGNQTVYSTLQTDLSSRKQRANHWQEMH